MSMYLEGVYTRPQDPETLHDAAAQLEELLPAHEVAEIAAVKSQPELLRWQLSLGDFVKDRFRLADPATALMQKVGQFGDADDFSHEIIVALWIRLQPKH